MPLRERPHLDPVFPLRDQTMRDRATDRSQSWALAAKELERVFRAGPPPDPPGTSRYVTAHEATAGLGLDPATKLAAEKGIRDMVSEQTSGFEVAKDLLERGTSQPVVKELLVRGMRMLAQMRATRAVHDLYIRKSGPPSGAGWQPIPRGKKGGFRRPKSGGGYEYAYPDAQGGYTTHQEPAADEGAHVHEEHEDSTPEPRVRARMAQLEAKARKAGLSLSGTATKRTTIKHVNELEKMVDRAVAQKAKKGDNSGKKLDARDVHATPGHVKPGDRQGKTAKDGGEDDFEGSDEPTKEKHGHDDDFEGNDDDTEFGGDDKPTKEVPKKGRSAEDFEKETGEKPKGDFVPHKPKPTHTVVVERTKKTGEREKHEVHVHAKDDADAADQATMHGKDDEEWHPVHVRKHGEPAPKEPTQREHRVAHIHALASRKGVGKSMMDKLLSDPDFQTDEGQEALIKHMEDLPDVEPEKLPDEVPGDPKEKKALEDHAAELRKTVAKMEKALAVEREKHGKELDALKKQVEALQKRPTPRATVEATHEVWGLALMFFGFAAGMLFAGPMGGLLGASMAHRYLKTGVLKSEPYEPFPLSPGLWLVDNSLILVKAMAHPAGAGWESIPGGKKGGYRRRKGDDYEYWYANAADHADHHEEKAKEHEGFAAASEKDMPGASEMRRGALGRSAAKQRELAAGHRGAAEAARGGSSEPYQDATRDEDGKLQGDNPHKGQRTLGPDEGKVWTAVTELFRGLTPDVHGDVNIDEKNESKMRDSVTVRSVDGKMHYVDIRVHVGGRDFSGTCHSNTIPARDETGNIIPGKTVDVPSRIILNVPPGPIRAKHLHEEARRVLSHELAHAMDNLTDAHAQRSPDYDGTSKSREYFNNPTEIVAYRHNIYRELNDPKVAEDVKKTREMWRMAPEDVKDIRGYMRGSGEAGEDVDVLAPSSTPGLNAQFVMQFLKEHSPTWAHVAPFLTKENRRKMLTMAAAVLQSHHDDTSEPTKKSLGVDDNLPPPPPLPGEEPPRIRARHGANEHGHTDGLVPGQKLTVRKGAEGPGYVTVLPDGAFQWGDNRYPNGRQLLKALTGREDAGKLTVRRYFGIGADHARLAKALGDALRVQKPALLVSPYQGRVRVEGDLLSAGIPGATRLDRSMLLDLQTVQSILTPETP